MSLPWHDRLDVALGPAAVVHVRRRLRLRAPRLERGVTLVQPAPGRAWAGSLEALKRALPELTARPARMRLVLSNHFVRYAVIPWLDDLRRGLEREAFVRHCFTQAYGTSAQRWVVRESEEPHGHATIACAVEHELVEALGEALRDTRLGLVALEPLFMAAFNEHRRALGATGCFLVHERGRLASASFAASRWKAALATRVDAPDLDAAVVEREALLHDLPGDAPVHLYIADGSEVRGTFSRAVNVLRPRCAAHADFAPALLGQAG